MIFLLFFFSLFFLLNIKTTYQIINDIDMLGKKENIEEASFFISGDELQGKILIG